jgi:hypothetical protein
MSTKSYRFILRTVHKTSYGDVTGPFHEDGRVIVSTPREVLMVGGPEEGICVDEVSSGIFRVFRPIKELPSIFLYAEKLVVNPQAKSILADHRICEGIGLLPVEIREEGKVRASYFWIYAKESLISPADIPEADLFLIDHVNWMVTDELRTALVALRVTGVKFEQVGK